MRGGSAAVTLAALGARFSGLVCCKENFPPLLSIETVFGPVRFRSMESLERLEPLRGWDCIGFSAIGYGGDVNARGAGGLDIRGVG